MDVDKARALGIDGVLLGALLMLFNLVILVEKGGAGAGSVNLGIIGVVLGSASILLKIVADLSDQ